MANMAEKLAALADAKAAAAEEGVILDAPLGPVIPQVEEVVEKDGYFGDYRLLNDFASPIKKVGRQYFPKDEAEIALLDYHVSKGHITKA
jgi:hypothetical protein